MMVLSTRWPSVYFSLCLNDSLVYFSVEFDDHLSLSVAFPSSPLRGSGEGYQQVPRLWWCRSALLLYGFSFSLMVLAKYLLTLRQLLVVSTKSNPNIVLSHFYLINNFNYMYELAIWDEEVVSITLSPWVLLFLNTFKTSTLLCLTKSLDDTVCWRMCVLLIFIW